jgi:hypothetical protein
LPAMRFCGNVGASGPAVGYPSSICLRSLRIKAWGLRFSVQRHSWFSVVTSLCYLPSRHFVTFLATEGEGHGSYCERRWNEHSGKSETEMRMLSGRQLRNCLQKETFIVLHCEN